MGNKNLDGKLVKQAHITQKFTDEDLEHLSKCMDPINGPHYFLENFFYIQHPVRGKIKYAPYDYQKQLTEYQGSIFYFTAGRISWFNKYLDKNNFLV